MAADPSADEVRALRARLRADLVAAMKARDPDAVSALRSAIAAIENAEAIDVAPGRGLTGGGQHVAGAGAGVGSTEARRRDLAVPDVLAILAAQRADAIAAAAHYEELGEAEAAARLRRHVSVLAAYLAG